MKKKILFALLLVAIFTCVFAISTSASEFKSHFDVELTPYEAGPNWVNVEDTDATVVLKKSNGSFVRVPTAYVFKANDNNQFVVNGSNFDFSWISEKLGEEIILDNLVALELPEGTKSISGSIAHATFTALEELVIPTSVTSLGQSMFRNNNVIRYVFVKQTLGEDGKVQGVTTLPGWFADITNGSTSVLEAFDFQLDYLTSIGNQCFQKSALKSFTAKGPMTSIGNAAFDSCSSLETVYIYNTGDTVGPVATLFQSCTNIKSITINGISIGSYFLQNANGLANGGLTLVATNVTSISNEAFKKAINLSNVDISGPITSIGNSIFLNCDNLANLKIVNTLDTPTMCGNNLCDGRGKLESVELHSVSVGAYAFRNINGTDMKVTITNCGYIGEGAFYKAANITELYIEGDFEYIGKSTYRECAKLKKLTIKNTGDTYVLIGNGESNPVLEELYIEGKIDVKDTPVFQNNVSLKHVYLGEGVREIGPNAFYKCYALETMYLADTITTIGDRAIDMDAASKQTSTSFMFVDENGNMDNTLPTSLTYIGGHFLKYFTISNTYLVFPEGFTNHNSEQAYDFEGTMYPEGFSLIYLGKMTVVNLHKLYQHNGSKDITVYLTKNSASDIKNYRVEANVGADGSISHGAYTGVNTSGTLEIVIDDRLHNNIKATEYIKFVFCGSDEVCFVTRVNIPWGDSTSSSWGNFVSTPVTYEQLAGAYALTEKAVPPKHPQAMVSAPEFSDATCTEPGGLKTYCLACGQIATIEKTADPLGHKLEIKDGATIVSVTYATYDASGIKVVNCATCHENCEVEAKAIFTLLGSSEKLFGDGAIAIGYEINKSAIADFEATGRTFKYGVYAVSKEKLGDNDIFGENGAFAGAMTKEITKYQNNAFELKLSGFTDAQKDKYFAMGAYVQIEAEGKSTYSYLQLGDVADGAKYSFVTYNGLTNE